MTPDLQAAVETAYRTFAPHGRPRHIDFAARVGASEEQRLALHTVLRTTPLRDLPLVAIDAYVEYIAAAHYDGGYRADEVRHFLPRALELIARGETRKGAPWLRENLALILERGARETWPATEIAAIDAVLAATDAADEPA
jgi:hypothetical protein